MKSKISEKGKCRPGLAGTNKGAQYCADRLTVRSNSPTSPPLSDSTCLAYNAPHLLCFLGRQSYRTGCIYSHPNEACITMAVESSHLPPPTFRLREEELPPELILSIERILELHTTSDSDPFDSLANDFNTVAALNQYFPDGESSCARHCRRLRNSVYGPRGGTGPIGSRAGTSSAE